MSTFLKFTLPALFAVAGLAVAVCLATNREDFAFLWASDAHLADVSQTRVNHPLNAFPRMLPRPVIQAVAWKPGVGQESAANAARGDASVVRPPTELGPAWHSSSPASAAQASIHHSPVSQPESLRSGLAEVESLRSASDEAATPAPSASAAPLYVAQAPGGGADQLPTLDSLKKTLAEAQQHMAESAKAATEQKANGQTAAQLLQSLPLPRAGSAPSNVEAGAAAAEDAAPFGAEAGPRSQTVITRVPGEGDDRLSLTIPGEDINKVLQMLSVQGDLNILASRNVQGTVSASLKNVKIETALDAILKSTGFIWWRDGRFIHVGTPQDRIAMQQAADKIGTRLYRPNYVKASDLQALITPILTPTIGTISVTSPAQVGITADGNSAGGDSFSGQEALLVRDYEIVLAEVEQIVAQVDIRPTQVAIEAMILSVNLNDKDEFGVDFEVLRNRDHIRIASGNPLGSLAQMDFTNGGLKVGFLDSSLALFLNALESVGDTNVIATPRLMCLNKQRAEILIGEQLGYVSTTQTETSTTQSVEFLEVGTQLRIRPFISSDGMVRMEVHPELSTGNVRLVGDFTLPDKRVTQVTTNIMVRDGCTVIIGGLLRDETSTTATQIPLFGSLPVIGPIFRQSSEEIGRQEILVLITPRIVYEPETCCRGDQAAGEFHHRHMVYSDQMFPFSKRYLGRKYFRLAQMAWDAGNARQALRLVNLAIHFDPINRAAIDLRVDIWNGNRVGDHTLPPEQGGPMLDGEQLPDWLWQRLENDAGTTQHPLNRGRTGNRHEIIRPDHMTSAVPVLPRAEVPTPQAEIRSGSFIEAHASPAKP